MYKQLNLIKYSSVQIRNIFQSLLERAKEHFRIRWKGTLLDPWQTNFITGAQTAKTKTLNLHELSEFVNR